MKLTSVIPKLVLLIFTSILAATGPAPAGEATTPGPARIDVMKLHSAPDGNYLVILQLDSREQRVNIHVKDGSADRGEKQTATPVTDESIDPPKAR